MATPSANDLTRQQLDELDSLLQRMLSSPSSTPHSRPAPAPLPASPLPQPPEFLVPTWRMDRPAVEPTVRSPHMIHDAEALLLVEQPNVTADRLGMSLAYAPAPLPTPTVPFLPLSAPNVPMEVPDTSFAGSTYTLPGSPSRLPEFDRIDLTELKAPEPVVLLHSSGTLPTEPVVSKPNLAKVPLLLWPLFACNWVIERVLRQFDAPIAHALKPKYKQILGTLGILMLIVAGIWASRGLGVNLKVK